MDILGNDLFPWHQAFGQAILRRTRVPGVFRSETAVIGGSTNLLIAALCIRKHSIRKKSTIDQALTARLT
jgi:hypothetical protein